MRQPPPRSQGSAQLRFAHLLKPLRTRAQYAAGVAANAEHEHSLTKLLFVDNPTGRHGYPDKFRDEAAGVYVRPAGVHAEGLQRALLTWKRGGPSAQGERSRFP